MKENHTTEESVQQDYNEAVYQIVKGFSFFNYMLSAGAFAALFFQPWGTYIVFGSIWVFSITLIFINHKIKKKVKEHGMD